MRVTLLSLAFVWAQGLRYAHDIEAAFAQAKKTKKPLWVMVSATWCGPCRWAEKNLLPQPWFAALVEKDFIPLKVYAASGEQSTPGADSLAAKYGVKGYPTFLYINPNGELFYRHFGVLTENDSSALDFWRRTVQEALGYRQELPALRKRFEKGSREPDLVRRYLFWAINCADSATLAPIWAAYLRVFPTVRRAWLHEPKAYARLFELAQRFSPARAYAFQVVDTLKAHLPTQEWLPAYWVLVEVDLGTQWMRLAQSSESTEQRLALAETLFTWARSHPMSFAEEVALAMLAEQFLRPKRTPAEQEAGFRYALRYHALTKGIEPLEEALSEAWADNLNGLAWNVCLTRSEPDQLWTAVVWAKEALSYQPDAWYIWDTLGALYYRLGRKKEAIQALSKAIDLAKAQGLLSSEYQETQALLQKAEALPD